MDYYPPLPPPPPPPLPHTHTHTPKRIRGRMRFPIFSGEGYFFGMNLSQEHFIRNPGKGTILSLFVKAYRDMGRVVEKEYW